MHKEVEPEERGRGELVIWRRQGKGMYVGRGVRVTVLEADANSVELAIEAPLSVVVSGPGTKLDQHLQAQMDREDRTFDDRRDMTLLRLQLGEEVLIGRIVRIEFQGEEGKGRAALLVRAPLNVAVTRDDFTHAQHMEIQQKREQGGRSAL